MHYAEIPDYVPVVLPLEGMFCSHVIGRRGDDDHCPHLALQITLSHDSVGRIAEP
jgi:hypothetical protein